MTTPNFTPEQLAAIAAMMGQAAAGVPPVTPPAPTTGPVGESQIDAIRRMAKGIGEVGVGGQVPSLQPRNVVRNPALEPDKNIVSADDSHAIAQVVRYGEKVARDGRKRVEFVLRIIATDSPTPVGSEVAVIAWGGDMFVKTLKDVIVHALHIPSLRQADETYMLGEVFGKVFGPEQTLVGRVVGLRCYWKKSDKKGTDHFNTVCYAVSQNPNAAGLYETMSL